MFRLVPDLMREAGAPARPAADAAVPGHVAGMAQGGRSAAGLAGVRPGDVLVVEAATAELALREVSAKLGDAVDILAAEKVRRGGLAGFFAQEVCRVTVRIPARPDANGGDAPAGVDDALLRMTAEAEAAEDDFGAVLRRRLSEEPALRATAAAQAAQASQVAALKELLREPPLPDDAPLPRDLLPGGAAMPGTQVASAALIPATVEDAPTAGTVPAMDALDQHGARDGAHAGAQDGTEGPGCAREQKTSRRAPKIGWTRDPGAAPGTGPVRWSPGALERLGLPAALIEATEAQEPVDDAGWLVALAAAVAPYCRPMPAGEALVAGPRADALAQALALPLVRRPEAPPAEGSVAVIVRDSDEARQWLGDVARGRWLHAVLGGTGWEGLLLDEPLVVSWVGDDWLPAALQRCASAGVVLGYGTTGPHGTVLRANPVDVALSVRALLPRR